MAQTVKCDGIVCALAAPRTSSSLIREWSPDGILSTLPTKVSLLAPGELLGKLSSKGAEAAAVLNTLLSLLNLAELSALTE